VNPEDLPCERSDGRTPAAEAGDIAELGRERRRGLPAAAVAFVIGLALLGAAVWVVLRDGQTLRRGLDTISGAPSGLVAAAVGLYLVNFLFASASFWVLTNRYGRVRYVEMLGLITAATIFNYLPLRPGMLGRVAYHKYINGIPVRNSLKVLASGLVCAGVAMVSLVVTAWLGHTLGLSDVGSVALMGSPLAIAGLGVPVIRAVGPAEFWRFPAAMAFRYLDMCVWTARYAMIFALIGRPLTPTSAAAVAFSSQVVMISPVQLGLREWVVGTAAGVLAAGESSGRLALPDSVADLTPGMLADLVNRTAEFSVAIPLGILATVLLYGRFRRVRRAMADQNANAANRQGPVAL
jgi:hypothetical protein